MIDDTKLLAEGSDMSDLQEEQSMFNFQNLFAMLVLNWQWFLLSLFICVCGALIYLRYATPSYQVSAKMLIKDDDNRRRSSANQMLANMQDFGFMSNSAGIENEMEILQSRILARDAVTDLKLYVQYYSFGRLSKQVLYGGQAVSVDLDSAVLNQWDRELLEGAKSIKLVLTKLEDGYEVKGETMYQGKPKGEFSQNVAKLPAIVKTEYGALTLTQSGKKVMENGQKYLVNILPPMSVATGYAKAINVAPTSKQTSIAELTLTDQNTRRGLDYLNQLAICYNRQANADKNEIALKTEEFINSRLEKIDAELGSTEDALETYKKRNAVTQLQMDATQSLTQSTQYETKLAEITSQIQLMDYLREFVDNPSNQYKIIPSNVGMTDHASIALITSYNTAVQERNRYLKTASLQAPQVVQLTSTLDDLQTSIRTALLQARRSADIQRQSLQRQLAKYQGRIGSTPEQERVLNQIGRQQEVKSGLYLLLLQKREENSISLAATADKGKLIDEPLAMGKVSPKSAIILLAAMVLGLGIPFGVIVLIQLLSYRIEGHEDLAKLTRLPIVADVPVASDSVKTAAGIVVQANKNNQIDEIFRGMRTNIQFMMKENDKVILFTSSTSGEGKTFLAANLAVSFALLGKKVVLAGLDIRKPALGRLFGTKDRTQGVTQLLVKDSVTEPDLRTAICPSGVNENLDLLLAGPTPPNPTELLARENLGQVIDLLKQKYDYIILDTAPVGLVTDTLQIARYASVNCYVSRADYTPKANIGILNQLVSEQKLSNCCLILNGVDMSKKKNGYYYGYGAYGKYGRYGYGRYGYGKYGYGNYGSYGSYADSRYSNKDDDSIKK
ncbi:GumC family protein [Xylanibacter ruminicola]|uniref:non-specific protein-tyrosine kinase n=1 Tax=Xylanibacter ruminicola TaxID=839 RepID=A0A1M6R8R5_XYLRU|nr:tyrosine-protein kinase [Xylanibacter ruminicola]SHK28830.1 capsular exopolysaccharide family [Xylanibacter ruminicola]